MPILADNVIFVMVDIQFVFRPHINDLDSLLRNSSILNRAAEILDLPLLITEQNPQGLGSTIEEIYVPQQSDMMEKTKFSIFDDEIEQHIRSKKKDTIVLYGIEAHICIMQSVLDALSKGYRPIIVEDAVSSISLHDKEIAIRRMIQVGGIVVSTQMLLFELLKDAIHPDFKTISKLIKHGI